MTVSGPPSLTGRVQVGSLDSGIWIADYRSLTIYHGNLRLYRAVRAQMEGGAVDVVVPVFYNAQAPWPLGPNGDPVRFSPPVWFDDGAGFDDCSGMWQPVIAAYIAADAGLRATSIVIDFQHAGEVTGGEYFSIGDRLHVIRKVTDVSGTDHTVSIWPPLRAPVTTGTELNFDRPHCLMRLASESSGDIDMDRGRLGSSDLQFVETF